MTVVLTISNTDLRRLCGLAIGDTSADADFTALVSAEQAVIEYQLDPLQLAATATDAGLAATLTLGVSEIIAGRYLQQQARTLGALDDFSVGPITVTASKLINPVQLAQQLSQHGALRISPFGKAGGSRPLSALSAKSAAAVAATVPMSDLLPVPPASDGATASTSSTGLFGTLQAGATGNDDSDPPNEFSSGFTQLSDPLELT